MVNLTVNCLIPSRGGAAVDLSGSGSTLGFLTSCRKFSRKALKQIGHRSTLRGSQPPATWGVPFNDPS